MNRNDFDNALSYGEIAEAGAGVGMRQVLEVLRNLEHIGKTVNKLTNPTEHVAAATPKRRLTGLGVRQTTAKH